jgi:His/Glu/Gln/Arg/opine family amino acid ABC transporter permease subunit
VIHYLQGVYAFIPPLLKGAELTVLVSVASYVLALIVGLIAGVARLSSFALVRILASIYVQFIRGTPLLLQVFAVYYVLPFAGIVLSPFVAGLLALTINYGAYMAEVFRAGILAVPKGQREAAMSIGMSNYKMMTVVILPQAIKIVIPPFGNFFVGIFKDSAMLSVITMNELMFTGEQIAAATYRNFEIFTIVGIMYFCISYPAAKLVEWVEMKLDVTRPIGGALSR